jgi:hypothetical protein
LHQFGVDIGPEEITCAATAFAEMRNQANITAGLIAKERGWSDADYRAVMTRIKKEQIPKDQVMPLYAERLAAIEAAVRANRIVTLPDRKAVIRLASPAEDAQLPAPHMNPPRLIGNTGEYGEFVLTAGMPPDHRQGAAFGGLHTRPAPGRSPRTRRVPATSTQFAKVVGRAPRSRAACSPS